jgi:hypothetical protein
MTVGDKTRHVISKGKNKGRDIVEVVYKAYLGKVGGKARYASNTRHERV